MSFEQKKLNLESNSREILKNLLLAIKSSKYLCVSFIRKNARGFPEAVITPLADGDFKLKLEFQQDTVGDSEVGLLGFGVYDLSMRTSTKRYWQNKHHVNADVSMVRHADGSYSLFDDELKNVGDEYVFGFKRDAWIGIANTMENLLFAHVYKEVSAARIAIGNAFALFSRFLYEGVDDDGYVRDFTLMKKLLKGRRFNGTA